jgi:hypothetical protein
MKVYTTDQNINKATSNHIQDKMLNSGDFEPKHKNFKCPLKLKETRLIFKYQQPGVPTVQQPGVPTVPTMNSTAIRIVDRF